MSGPPPRLPPSWPPPAPAFPPDGLIPPPPPPQFSYAPPHGWGHHPFTIGRVLSLAWSLYRFRWKSFLAIVLIIWVPLAAIVAVFQLAVVGDLNQVMQAQRDAILSGRFDNLLALSLRNSGLSLLTTLVTGIFGLIGNGALVDLTMRVYTGWAGGPAEAIRTGFRRVPTLIGISLLIIFAIAGIAVLGGLAIAAATLIAIVASGPGTSNAVLGAALVGLLVLVLIAIAVFAELFFVIRWSLSVQVAMVEGTGAVESLRRSWHLVRGSTWRTLGYLLVFGIIVGVIAAIVSATAAVLLGSPIRISGFNVEFDPTRYAITVFVTGVVAALLAPIPTIALTLLYLDLRWRQGEHVPLPGSASTGI